jgi:hypothetical protein
VKVKLLSVDEKGRMRLSRKVAMAEEAAGGSAGSGNAEAGETEQAEQS